MNPSRTNDLWCKRCLWHTCRCMPAPVVFKTRAELEEMFPSSNSRQGWFATTELQYTRTMTMDDLRRNALESVIEELKERDA